MKVSFGKGIYKEAMQGLEMDVDVVTFDAEDESELATIIALLKKNRCDAIIQFGDDEEWQT